MAGVLSVDVVPTAILVSDISAIKATLTSSGKDFALLGASTGDANIDQIMTGAKWSGSLSAEKLVLTYSFSDSNYTNPLFPLNIDTSELGSGAKAIVRDSFSSIEKFTNLRFAEVEDDGSTSGDIRIGYTSFNSWGQPDDFSPGGLGFFPGYFDGHSLDGDLFLRSDYGYDQNFENAEPGSWFYNTIIHEIGHVLGLAHPHHSGTQNPLYTFGEDTSIGEWLEDGNPYTVMSYATISGAGGSKASDTTQAETYMANDITA